MSIAALNVLEKSDSQSRIEEKSNIAVGAVLFVKPNMTEEDEAPPIYRALMTLKPANLTLGAWAREAKLARNYFNDLRVHGNPKADVLKRLLDVVGMEPAQFAAMMEPIATEVRALPGALQDRSLGYLPGPTSRPLPLVGTATGGEYGDLDEDIELTELHLSEVIDHLPRPASLADDTKAYALTIVGDSMSPRFRPGERVAVSPRAPIAIGDDVIVQLRGTEDNGERIKMVLIKELVRRTASHVELRQYNPDRVFKIEARRVAAMHKVSSNFFG